MLHALPWRLCVSPLGAAEQARGVDLFAVAAVAVIVPTDVEEDGNDSDEGRRMPTDFPYRIEEEVTNPGRRSVSASHRVPVMQGEFRLRVDADPSILQVGQRTEVTIEATDHDGNPVQVSGDVQLKPTEWMGSEERLETRETALWHTDRAGTTTVTFEPHEGGSYHVLVTATDSRNNRIAAGSGCGSRGKRGSATTTPTASCTLSRTDAATGKATRRGSC